MTGTKMLCPKFNSSGEADLHRLKAAQSPESTASGMLLPSHQPFFVVFTHMPYLTVQCNVDKGNKQNNCAIHYNRWCQPRWPSHRSLS